MPAEHDDYFRYKAIINGSMQAAPQIPIKEITSITPESLMSPSPLRLFYKIKKVAQQRKNKKRHSSTDSEIEN
jgi:hypothetical protein